MKRKLVITFFGGVFMLAIAPRVNAQIQTTGVPGTPSATTTISGKQLPAPAPPNGGVEGSLISNSKIGGLQELFQKRVLQMYYSS